MKWHEKPLNFVFKLNHLIAKKSNSLKLNYQQVKLEKY
ncbi:MAG: hypothetical protein ACI8WW_002445 [Oceanospirillaceae bacterium]|jgi:hypothetical protein